MFAKSCPSSAKPQPKLANIDKIHSKFSQTKPNVAKAWPNLTNVNHPQCDFSQNSRDSADLFAMAAAATAAGARHEVSIRGGTYDFISCDFKMLLGFCDFARYSSKSKKHKQNLRKSQRNRKTSRQHRTTNPSKIENNPSKIEKSKQHLEITGNEIIGFPFYTDQR